MKLKRNIGLFVQMRGEGMSKKRLNSIRKALHTLHKFEIMAVNIYRFQIMNKRSDLQENLIAAMWNEMGHVQDFQVKIFEYGYKPVWSRCFHWLIGWYLGISSRLKGQISILKMGIWTESRAIKHYDEILKSVEWDDDTRRIIEQDRTDEIHHLETWRAILDDMI